MGSTPGGRKFSMRVPKVSPPITLPTAHCLLRADCSLPTAYLPPTHQFLLPTFSPLTLNNNLPPESPLPSYGVISDFRFCE